MSGIRDLSGNGLVANAGGSFTTVANAAPDVTPGASQDIDRGQSSFGKRFFLLG